MIASPCLKTFSETASPFNEGPIPAFQIPQYRPPLLQLNLGVLPGNEIVLQAGIVAFLPPNLERDFSNRERYTKSAKRGRKRHK